jgi:cytochrome c2
MSGSFLDLGAALWNHVPGMSVRFQDAEIPWPHLSRQEAVELTAFLYFIEYLGRPGNPAVGREIFSDRTCATCHTIGGTGRESAPDLAELKRFVSPLYLAQAIWNHGPTMFESMHEMGIAPPHLDQGDLADLSAFVRQASAPGPRERMLLAPGNPNRGETIFEDKGCSICHAVSGPSDQTGPDLAKSDLHNSAEAIAGAMWNHALAMNASMQEHGIPWPEFTTTDLADLIAFLYFLAFADAPGDAERGAEVFTTRSCVDCHALAGSADKSGPDLSSSMVATSPAALVASMWNHSPVMKEAILGEGLSWPELSGDDLRDLLAYLGQGAGQP